MGRNKFQGCIEWRVGNRRRINFWTDLWFRREHLEINSPKYLILHKTKISQSVSHLELIGGLWNDKPS